MIGSPARDTLDRWEQKGARDWSRVAPGESDLALCRSHRGYLDLCGYVDHAVVDFDIWINDEASDFARMIVGADQKDAEPR